MVQAPPPPVFIGVPAQLQLAVTTSFVVFAFPSLHASPIFADKVGQSYMIVPAQLQLAVTTSFVVLAFPSSHASPIFDDKVGQSNTIAVPAQLQLPSSTSFVVLAFPSSHAVPAGGHAASLLTVIKLLEISEQVSA